MRTLTEQDIQAAVRGGSVLACGGGGWVDHGFKLGRTAVGYGPVQFATLDELPEDGLLITVAAIGAPAAVGWHMDPKDYVRAVELVMSAAPGKVVGFMNSQNGSSSTLNSWVPAAIFGLPAVDVAGNGRAHPTAKMGSMGLATNTTYEAIQAAVGGNPEDGPRLELLVKGTVSRCANILRTASSEYGGFIASARNPLPVKFVRQNGAVGAPSFAMRIGAAMCEAEADGPEAVLDALCRASGGEIIGRGEVTERVIDTRGAFDYGHIRVGSGADSLVLHVMNEYMAVDNATGRISTFPDAITTLSLETGLPVSVRDIRTGMQVAVLRIDRDAYPLGAAMWEPAVYEEVEEKMGIELLRYGLPARR